MSQQETGFCIPKINLMDSTPSTDSSFRDRDQVKFINWVHNFLKHLSLLVRKGPRKMQINEANEQFVEPNFR